MADTGEVAEMETETMSDIELSSDSEQEEEGDEVSLIVMKRPNKIERTVKDIEVSIVRTSFTSNKVKLRLRFT